MNQSKIYDIAGAAGVSLATVSRVLNHPEKVKESTRNKVLRIIKEKGYKPNANARGLASRRSTTVAVVIPELSRASVAEMIQGIDEVAKKMGYTIRLFINKDQEKERDFWGEVIASSVDGILFMNDEMTKEAYQQIEHTPVPVVFVNSLSQKDTIGSVCVDYEQCAYDITKIMIARGNKKIVFVGTEHKYTLNEMKQKGYVRAMQEAGLPVDIIYSSGDISKNEVFFNNELEKRIPDVALVVRDSMAISFMNVATRKGIKVPEQFQIIGMQNTRYAILSNPKLTCTEIPIYEMGNRAMSYLTELMRNEESKGQKILLPYSIVWRESTK
ncbi:MAG TPA: LacI family DNA-binding transcriptional regulator [Bacilli bacterium]|jgi:LacI family transcriptional regulator|nr:LacI family DNA-binding transcriptional regulator [Bacilli bacterium]NLT01756.1 LacI family transcriptional regulator [Acholeplasmataceae bacterium]HNZ77269.1 LacI family DNA-binding transcriptional regulator [Bacilli bacterium]HOD60612.1 LacI family DNA-binding transcriptional regulator [Bacilli bacterium]HOE06722.1 LacI family DNA-binding transcriptional regulator [Bacilli bacterium]